MNFFYQIACLSLLVTFFATETNAQIEPYLTTTCPKLTATGGRLPLPAKELESATNEVEDEAPGLDFAYDAAIAYVAGAEAGGNDPYTMLTTRHDVLSIGHLQWNWSTRSLINVLLAATPEAAIALANPAIRDDLMMLKSSVGRSKAIMTAVGAPIMDRWTTGDAQDPEVDGLRRSVREALATWLGTQEMRGVQDEIIQKNFRIASALARKWSEQSPMSLSQSDLTIATVMFFDQFVLNGSRGGLWRTHALALREQFDTNLDVLEFVLEWTRQCRSYQHTGTLHTKMYTRDEAVANAELWYDALTDDPDAFSDLQIELLLYSYIRATRSTGSNPGNGFSGIYQTDVLVRSATVVMGMGTVHGAPVISLANR